MLAPGSEELTGENVGSVSGFTTPAVRRKELPTPTLQAQTLTSWTIAVQQLSSLRSPDWPGVVSNCLAASTAAVYSSRPCP